MTTLSVCMIVKNESEVLGRCLDCIKDIADEIIIVDTGSTDDTISIAQNYTSNIYKFQWIDDFSAARNYSFSKATMEYVMWLDADDIILEEDKEKILQLKTELDGDISAVYLYYNTGVDENGKPSLSYYRERIVKNGADLLWIEPVHEHLSYIGKSMKSDAAITHGHKTENEQRSNRNLNIYEKQIANGTQLSPRAQYYYARELRTHNRIDDAIEMYQKFLENETAWYEDKITACLDLSYCYASKDDSQNVIDILFHCLTFAVPRQDICCRLGDYFREKSLYKQAIFWYNTALSLPKPDGMGFVFGDYLNFIPHIWLCVCHDRLGEYDIAKLHNDTAKLYKPNHPSVIKNSEYYDRILGK